MAFAPVNTLRFLLAHPLTRSRPLEALVRYARWQLASRLATGPIAVDYVAGSRLLVRRGMTGATGNIYAGLHEYRDMAFLLHTLRSTDLFVDVGANIGSYTVLAAKVVGAHVVAFEPVASTFESLEDNLSLNGIANLVEAHQVCVGSTEAFVNMTTELDSVNHVLLEAESGVATTRVRVTRLDDVLAERAPFMIKLDVEGYELEALLGAERTLGRVGVQCIIMEMNECGDRYGRTDNELLKILTRHGFGRVGYEPRERRLIAADVDDGSAIFIRDHRAVERRLLDAPRLRVLGQEL